jgi:hypothetical protein
MSDKPDTLLVAGLPPLTWVRKSGWRCDAVLAEWAGLTPRRTDDEPPGQGLPTTGAVSVSFGCPDVYARTPPSAAQVAAFRRLVADGEAIRDAVLRAAFDEFHDWLSGDDTIADELGGPLVEPAQLTRLIALNVVDIGRRGAAGRRATVDLEFDCAVGSRALDHRGGGRASGDTIVGCAIWRHPDRVRTDRRGLAGGALMAKRRSERLTGPALDQRRAEVEAVLEPGPRHGRGRGVRTLTASPPPHPPPAAGS